LIETGDPPKWKSNNGTFLTEADGICLTATPTLEEEPSKGNPSSGTSIANTSAAT
jgi:hypothetical protein